MEQIKASKLFKDLCYNSQKAFIDEDKHLYPALNELIQNNPTVNYITLLEILRTHDEFIRLSLIKTIIQTLIDNQILSNDLQIFNNKNCDIMYVLEINKARKEIKDIE